MILRADTPAHIVKRVAGLYYYKRNLSAFRYRVLYRRALIKETRRFRAEYFKIFREANDVAISTAFGQRLKVKVEIPEPDVAQFATRLIRAFIPIYTANITGSANDALLLAGLSSVDFVPNTPAIGVFLRARTKATSGIYSSQTDALVRQSLIQGINQGESIRNLEGRITSSFKQAEGYRAERIARSESIRSTNFASVESWKQSGVVSGKQWSAIIDDRTHEDCLALHGRTWGLNDTILESGQPVQEGGRNYDYENIEHPPLFPNCRCTLLPVQG